MKILGIEKDDLEFWMIFLFGNMAIVIISILFVLPIAILAYFL